MTAQTLKCSRGDVMYFSRRWSYALINERTTPPARIYSLVENTHQPPASPPFQAGIARGQSEYTLCCTPAPDLSSYRLRLFLIPNRYKMHFLSDHRNNASRLILPFPFVRFSSDYVQISGPEICTTINVMVIRAVQIN